MTDIKPGIYYDLSFGEYLSLPIPSASSIKIGHKVSMRHMKAAIAGELENKDSKAKSFGRALHCFILEPERFKDEYSIGKPCDAKFKTGARKGMACGAPGKCYDAETETWYCKKHGVGMDELDNLISEADERDINGVGEALRAHPVYQRFTNAGISEHTIIVEVEGVLVKTRYDYLSIEHDGSFTIVDLKKIGVLKGSDYDLQKTIRDYQYDLQAALYVAAHRAAFEADAKFLWVFAEDGQPYEIVPRYMGEAMRAVGEEKAFSTLRRWNECCEWGQWPGYCDEAIDIDPADWEAKQYGVLC